MKETNSDEQDAGVATPLGKSSESLCHVNDLDKFNCITLELESAQLELEAAEAMRRAAEAKRRAATALRKEKEHVGLHRELQVDSEVCSKLPMSNIRVAAAGVGSESEDKPEFQGSVSTRDADDLNKVEQLLARMELPKCEIPYFDGSPLHYVLFFRQFEEQVERHLRDDSQRLTYLFHYCKGKAKEAIQGCLLFPAHEGYKRARVILKELFGQRHLIVRAMLDEVTNPGMIPLDADSLSSYANKLTNCADALEQLGFVADLNSISTIDKILSKLPRFMVVDWVKRADEIYLSDREPVFRDVCEFVGSKARLQRNRYSYFLNDRTMSAPSSAKQFTSQKRTYVMSVRESVCNQCKGNHALADCRHFINLDIKDRWALISKLKLCFICLRAGHQARNCPDKRCCEEGVCNQLHHPLLHQPRNPKQVLTASCQGLSNSLGVYLGIIPVRVQGPNGCFLVNALLDTGADTSLIRADLAAQLGLYRNRERICLNTPIGNAMQNCFRVAFQVKSLDGFEVIEVKRAYTVPSILDMKSDIPSKELLSKWSHLEDINFSSLPSAAVSVLLGLDIPEVHWILEQRRGRKGDPYADLTPLGWVLRGPMDESYQKSVRTFAMHYAFQEIENNLRSFYDRDFLDNGSTEIALSVEDERAVDAAEKSLRLDDGHMCIGLPWKDNGLRGLCNRSMAVRRLACLSRRFQNDQDFKEKYSAVISRYIHKGWAVKTQPVSDHSAQLEWYLPHHAVFNPKKPGKLRVVFDCAAKFQGDSLNGHLLQGPNMVSNLVEILLRFRQGPVALSADIEDMFLQVKVPEEDQGALKFLWWPDGDPSNTVEQYCLTVHPFGAVSSPFCASFALKKTVTMFGHDFPVEVSQVVLNSFYVDDCLISLNDESEALTLVEELSNLLSKGGFHLTKWLSNSREVLNAIPADDRNSAVKSLLGSPLPTQRTLGVAWDTDSDSFKYEIQHEEIVPTRRIILSRLAAVYDPLGWISPYILPMKLLFQELCRRGTGWDEKLDESMKIKWRLCNKVLKGIENVSIPRWYAQGIVTPNYQIEQHIFCDASEVGFGAVVYFRLVCDHLNPRCVLVMAKSRVAPLKAVTIPRLELTAAVVAVELAKLTQKGIRLPIRETVFWTDSAVVLYYLRDDKSRFSTFVANRISKIKESSSLSQWKQVSGHDNPADIASRGMKLRQEEVKLWFEGPEFLQKPHWIEPNRIEILRPPNELLEFKSVALVSTNSHNPLLHYLERFSTWNKLLRCVAWMMRYKQYLLVMTRGQADSTVRVGLLSLQELRNSCNEVISLVQSECFGQELALLRKNRNTNSRRLCVNLRKLNPILIGDHLCVGGRLHWSDLSDNAKHPIILPPVHHVTTLLIRHYHELEGHVGCTQVLSMIRKKYWIIQGRAAVRRVIGKCLWCRRESVRPCVQQMAPLPAERSTYDGYAFAHTGVDYFGPFYVKRGRSEEKRYGCLFTCLNIRAVHIEVTHSLSTDAFLQALIRFIARRGQPKIIFSDNGSNFKGAYRELRNNLENLSQTRITHFLIEREIEWRFGPPEASHWGGVWERMIRSVRRILRTIAHGQRMTDEALVTFLAEVERIMNNRPLVPLTDDCKDLDVLTPSKLLLLRGNDTMMDGKNFPRSCLKVWRTTQVLADTFWKRWKVEYLAALQERQKWFDKTKNIKIGDLVLVVDESTHRSQWPLGLVQDVHSGSDGIVREVMVHTTHGSLRRDIRKICLLEGDLS